MNKLLVFTFSLAACMWAGFAAILLGSYQPSWLPAAFLRLARPNSLVDFGQAFAALEGLTSSFALTLGLISILMQARQNADANVIVAYSTRLQYLLADSERLEQQIQELKTSDRFDATLFGNMVSKKKRQLDEAKSIDEKLRKLLEKI